MFIPRLLLQEAVFEKKNIFHVKSAFVYSFMYTRENYL